MQPSEASRRAGFRPFWLDTLNFWLADVRAGLGPYLNVFLITQQHWPQASVGLVTTVSGLFGIATQTPIGAAIDATRAKRGLLVVALIILAASAVVIWAWPYFWPVMIANTAMAIVGDVFGPVVAALTLGLYARSALARRMGRNSAFDHAGNVVVAGLAGVIGWLYTQRSVFLIVPVCCALAAVATLAIPGTAIDHARARGGEGGDEAGARDGQKPSGLKILLTCRPLLVFAGCAALFHFANAMLLPLVGQKLALAHKGLATALISACIIAAQLIMLPIALAVGRFADRVGRRPILLIGFGILPIRAVMYTFSNASGWLIGVQLLDGVGAGIFGAIVPLLVADLMRGTGRYNVALGAITTAQGIGASLSGLVVGEIVGHFGYAAAFLECAAAAAAAFALLALALPETAPQATGAGGKPQARIATSSNSNRGERGNSASALP
jgi:MFS family permease